MLLASLCVGTTLLRSAPQLAVQQRARTIVASAAAREFEEVPSFRDVVWPDEWPFADPRYFARADETPDSEFYAQPRFVTHIDDGAIQSICDYYASVMHEGADVCDLCSSWISHLPPDLKLGRVAGLGMNEEELLQNERLTEYAVQDLNDNPKLPYDDASFDFVCNVVSVDCEHTQRLKPSTTTRIRVCRSSCPRALACADLNKPLEIFKEMHRVLKPGGSAIMSFSNRCVRSSALLLSARRPWQLTPHARITHGTPRAPRLPRHASLHPACPPRVR